MDFNLHGLLCKNSKTLHQFIVNLFVSVSKLKQILKLFKRNVINRTIPIQHSRPTIKTIFKKFCKVYFPFQRELYDICTSQRYP